MEFQQEDFQSLSIADRLQHKVWKARQSAYIELYDLFKKTVDDSDFGQYEECLKNIATDVNAVAQETGLNTIYEYVNNAPNSSRTCTSVVPALVSKCLGAPKSGTKQKATDIILLYAEVDMADPIVELVIPGIHAKQPKLVAQTVVVLRELVRQFGAKTINPKPLIKILPKLFGHTDKNVRAEAFTLAVEIYKWIGSALVPSLSELKPVQMKELEVAFGKLPSQRPSPERIPRSQQRKMAEASTAEVGIGESLNASADDDVLMEEPMDSYDLADPIDITTNLPGNFYELLESKKWQERREALDSLLASAKTPKVMDKDYSELLGALAKRINDANILLVGAAANCIEAIATGLRADFGKYKGLVVPPLVEKLKERKPAILEQLANALHSIFSHLSIMEITEAMDVAVKHKNPQIRTQSVKLVTRQLQIIRKVPSKLETKTLAELVLKTLDDADGAAREASAEGLGTLMNVVGERSMLPFMNSLDDIKKNKIKEFCDKTQTKAKQTITNKPTTTLTKTPQGPKKINKQLKPLPSKPEPMAIDEPTLPSTMKRRLSTSQTTTSNKKPTPSISNSKLTTALATNTKSSKKATKLPTSNEPQEVKFKYSSEDAEARVNDYIPAQIWEDIGSSQWKVRLAAMESLCTHFGSGVESSSIEAEIVMRCLSKKPGWKEMNFQVMTKFYNVMQLLATDCPSFSRSCVALGIPGIVEKLGDAKLKKPAGECLVAFAESTTLQFVLSQSYLVWKKAKSPKVVTDALIWIHQALLDFGVVGLQVRDLIGFVKNALANSNPTVRTKAVSVLGVLRMYLGADVITFVQDVSPALMTTIENEFEKVSKMDPPQPTKTASTLKTKASQSKTGTSNSDHAGSAGILNSMIPRTDISTQLKEVVPDCSDVNWKRRKEGLNQVVSIIETANKRIKPNLGEFPDVLQQRLADSNKLLQIQAVEITGLLVFSMGKPFEKYLKLLSGSITSVLNDNKPSVRNAGVATLDIIRETCGLDGLIGAFGIGLASDSPILRKELLAWLLKSMNEQGPSMSTVDYSPLISPILSCLQDRNSDVRKAAHAILPSVAISSGFEKVMHKVSELNNTQRQTVMPFVESIRGSVPASSTKTTSTNSLALKARRLSASSTSHSTAPEPLHSNIVKTTELGNDSNRHASNDSNRRVSGNDSNRRVSGNDSNRRVSGSGRQKLSDPWNTITATIPTSTTAATKRTSVGSPSTAPSRSNLSSTQYAEPSLLTNDPRSKRQRSKEPEQKVYTMNDIIRQIALGTDPIDTIDALKYLVKYVNTAPETVQSESDALIKALILQSRAAYSMVDPLDSVRTRLCKHIVNTLVIFFSKCDLAGAVTKETLISLLEELASRLLDERIASLESGPQLSKALNVAMVKVLENCQQNATFSALLSILGKCASDLRPNDSLSGMNTRYTELVMKCLWKSTKTIQGSLHCNKLSPSQLLFDINEFFLLTHPDEWKRRAREKSPLGDLPLRTVKTLILEIVTGLGDRVFDNLSLIDHPQHSIIYPYLQHMLLEACKKKGGIQQRQQLTNTTTSSTLQQQDHQRNDSAIATGNASSLPNQHDVIMTDVAAQQQSVEIQNSLSGTTALAMDIDINDALRQIFDKIGTKEKTKEGIAELYAFQKKYPLAESKVNGYLSKTGSYFQRYIQRGLSSLAENDQPSK